MKAEMKFYLEQRIVHPHLCLIHPSIHRAINQ